MARALADHLAPLRDRFVASAARPLALIVVVLGVLAVSAGWVFASPPGASPDDDYHLVSSWCPRPATSSCATTTIDGNLYVMAPVTTSHAPCEAFKADKSHACIYDYSDDTMFPTDRYNDGQYPYGFYQFHHLFTGHNVEHSVWVMRAINAGIAIILMGAIAALSRRSVRFSVLLAALVSWTPIGLYFIASNNPSSWAITGVFCYGAALYSALNAQGWRRWALLGAAAFAALLCYGSRGDAAFYVFVASLGILILAATRRHLPEIGIATVLSIIGVWCMLGSGQSGHIAQSDASVTLRERIDIAIMNIRYLPEYFAGFVGLDSGPGWRDTHLPGYTTIIGLLVLGAVIFFGARAMSWRKALAAFVVFGAMAGIPLLIATPPTFPNLGGYHSRYALPLLGTWLVIWLASSRKNSSITKGQLTIFVFFMSVVDAVAMHTTIARYVSGLLYIPHLGWIAPGNLNGNIQWWWAGAPITPMTLWIIATAGYTLALIAGSYLIGPRVRDAEEADAPTAHAAIAPPAEPLPEPATTAVREKEETE